MYFHSKNGLVPMFNSLFGESPGAKGSPTDALFNWIVYLFEQYSYRRELVTALFSLLIYIGLDKYVLPRYYDEKNHLYRIFKFNFTNKQLFNH